MRETLGLCPQRTNVARGKMIDAQGSNVMCATSERTWLRLRRLRSEPYRRHSGGNFAASARGDAAIGIAGQGIRTSK